MGFDLYTFQARLRPALLVVMPFGLIVACVFPPNLLTEGVVVALITTFGFTALLSELGRDLGRKKQDKLWKSWGGPPSMRMLRHRDKSLAPLTRSRYHAKLEALLGRKMPTVEDEKSDPNGADLIYRSCGDYLLENTRGENGTLILKENISYGFRRNLWGMKSAGTLLSAIGVLVCGGIAAYRWTQSHEPAPIPIMGVVLCAVLLTLWLFRINPDWVRLAAEAYAKRLLAACEQLGSGQGQAIRSDMVEDAGNEPKADVHNG